MNKKTIFYCYLLSQVQVLPLAHLLLFLLMLATSFQKCLSLKRRQPINLTQKAAKTIRVEHHILKLKHRIAATL